MKTIVSILMIIGLFACFVFRGKKAKADIVITVSPVEKTDTSLQLINGIYYYRQNVFSGIITDKFTTGGLHHIKSIFKGTEEGWQLNYYPDGSIAERRYYHLGEKDSIHTGWWQDGKPRFEYHFTNGIYNGSYKEWYSSGTVYKHIYYNRGTDIWGKGWRENGKLFMNYTMRNGRRYGIVNSNLCYTLKNENGDFTGISNKAKTGPSLNTGNKPH